MFNSDEYVAISGTGNYFLSENVLKVINKLGRGDIRFLHFNMDEFVDGEQDFTIPECKKINGKHVLVFQSLHQDKHGLGSQFLTLIWAAKNQFGAKSVTGIALFFQYRRQEKFKKETEIDRNLMFTQALKDHGLDRLLLCDIHSVKTLENCEKVGLRVWNTDPTIAYSAYLRPLVELARREGREFYVYSPDNGSIMRSIILAKELGVGVAAGSKERSAKGNIELVDNSDEIKAKLVRLSEEYGIKIIADLGQLKGCDVCVREDEIESGDTSSKTGKFLKEKIQIHRMYFCVTHTVLTSGWRRKFLDDMLFDNVFVGNTIPRDYPKKTGGIFTTVDMSQVIGNKLFEVLNENL